MASYQGIRWAGGLVLRWGFLSAADASDVDEIELNVLEGPRFQRSMRNELYALAEMIFQLVGECDKLETN